MAPDEAEQPTGAEQATEAEAEHPTGGSMYVKCRAKRLFKLIPKLNDAKRRALSRIGFGGLLELKFSSFPLAYVEPFLDAFSDGSYVFRTSRLKEFTVSKHDVHDCFLLPYGPNQLEIVQTGRGNNASTIEATALKKKWRERYNIRKPGAPIPIQKLLDELEASAEGGDDFCRLFVLFCMSSFLCPTSNNSIDLKILKAVEDVSAIKNYDWCTYVLEGMVSAAESSLRSPTNLLGCIPFLMITYFQRFDYKGKACEHDLPFIKHWDEARLKDRCAFEIDKNKGLGRLSWSMVKYPRCTLIASSAPVSHPIIPITSGGEHPLSITAGPKKIIPITSGGEHPLSITAGPKKFIQIELPAGVKDDEELKAAAVDIALKLKQSAVNAPEFKDFVGESKTEDGPERAAELQVAGVLHDLSKDATDDVGLETMGVGTEIGVVGGKGGNVDELDEAKDKNPELFEDFDIEFYNTVEVNEVTFRAGGVENDGSAERQETRILLERLYSEADVDEAFRLSDEVARGMIVGLGAPYVSADVSLESEDSDRVVGVKESKFVVEEELVVGEPEVPSSHMIQSSFNSSADIHEAFKVATEPASGEVVLVNTDGHEAGITTEEVEHVTSVAAGAEEPAPTNTEVQGVGEGGVSVEDKRVGGHAVSHGEVAGDLGLGASGIPFTLYSTTEIDEVVGGAPTGGVDLEAGGNTSDIAVEIWTAMKHGKVVDRGTELHSSWDTWMQSNCAAFDLDSDLRSAGTELARTPDKRMRSTDSMEEAEVTAVPIRSAGSLNDTCVRSRRRGRGDGLGCTLQCGDVEENVLLVARSLRLNLTLLKNVQTLRKHVVDYCFLDDWNYAHNEQLVYYNRHAALTRANMLTMLPDVSLCDAVIECWSMLMNRLETDEYDFQRMSFFGIGHMEYLNQLLQSADQTTQDDTILDNLYEMRDLYIQDSQDGSALSDYLESKGIDRGREMVMFEHRQIKLPWQSSSPNLPESGLFTMMHMLMYDGNPFDNEDLRRKISRRYLVFQLTAALILADINTIRDEVVGKVNQFLVEKDDIWTRVHAQRKINKIIKKK
ncbi:hypothetical protein KSS87_000539 [Heliosperma pusillum]|nr:hypothetical protein KSS87_000539 [Heliosperma pusillum]